MAQKGEFKTPVESPVEAFYRVMRRLDEIDCDFAIYAIGGVLRCTTAKSKCFENRIKTFGNSLIGIYSCDVDVRMIKQDIEHYYEQF